MWLSGAGITLVSLVPRAFVELGVWQSLLGGSKRLPHPTVLGGAFSTTGNSREGNMGLQFGSLAGCWTPSAPTPAPCSEGGFIQLTAVSLTHFNL